ncbi:hypothetical protein FQZ97_1018600 [compost metagenome]
MQRRTEARLADGAHEFAALDLRDEHDVAQVGDAQVDALTGAVAQPAHHRQRQVRDAPATPEGRAHREAAHAHVPEVGLAIELHEAPLLERGEQPVRGGRRQARVRRDVDQPEAFVVLGQEFEQLHGARERLHGAVVVAVDAGDLGGLGGGARRAGCHGVPCANCVPSGLPVRLAIWPPMVCDKRSVNHGVCTNVDIS